MLRAGDRSLVEGQVDLAFRENGGNQARWTVVNFKTDRELGTREARSQEQVRLYARAIGSANREAAEGVLLLV